MRDRGVCCGRDDACAGEFGDVGCCAEMGLICYLVVGSRVVDSLRMIEIKSESFEEPARGNFVAGVCAFLDVFGNFSDCVGALRAVEVVLFAHLVEDLDVVSGLLLNVRMACVRL